MSRARPYLADGLDYQGRHPEAASACTEIGAEPADHPEDMTGAEAWLLMGIYIASVLVSVGFFSFLAGLL